MIGRKLRELIATGRVDMNDALAAMDGNMAAYERGSDFATEFPAADRFSQLQYEEMIDRGRDLFSFHNRYKALAEDYPDTVFGRKAIVRLKALARELRLRTPDQDEDKRGWQ